MAKLSLSQMRTLKKHSEHHSKKHMDMMKKLMREGSSFKAAHKKAQKDVGKWVLLDGSKKNGLMSKQAKTVVEVKMKKVDLTLLADHQKELVVRLQKLQEKWVARKNLDLKEKRQAQRRLVTNTEEKKEIV